MKKEKLITRTVYTYKVKVMGIDESESVAFRDYEVPAMDERKIIDFIKKNYPESIAIPVKVVGYEVVEQLYGMPESVFMKYAEKLPPRKQYNNEKEEG